MEQKQAGALRAGDFSREFVEKTEEALVYINTLAAPFVLGALARPEENAGEYYRLDAQKKESYSEANRSLAVCTAGANVRFVTDAEKIRLCVTLRGACVGMHHFADRGVWGVDSYIGSGTGRRYVGAIMQTFADSPEYNEGELNLGAGEKEVMIELPLYAGIEKLVIGFPADAHIAAAPPRGNGTVAFYGSSITQGGCVSRPANAYTNILCRAVDADCRNFGFSGSAMGEQSVAAYIAACKLRAFVMDYDYNAPSLEHLRQTHAPFYATVRAAQPALPVIFVTHPFYGAPTENDLTRISIVRETYERARDAGEPVWFVDSREFFPEEMRDLYAVDNLHPNDLGQMYMARAILPALRAALQI